MAAEKRTSVAPTLAWIGGVDGHLRIIDQTLLPAQFREIDLADPEKVWEAIRSLRVRGAPAIGVAAAYGLVLGLGRVLKENRPAVEKRVAEVADYLATSRPTAVNLFWALDRMRRVGGEHPDLPAAELIALLLEEARKIEQEDCEMCAAIGRHGAELLADGTGVLTHCNAGSLATAGEGTALSVIYAAIRQGKKLHVFVDETRPAAAGSAAHVVGTHPTRDSRDAAVRFGRGLDHARRTRAGRRHGGRPDRRQRRLGQQDRHVLGGRAGQGSTRFRSTSPLPRARLISKFPTERRFPSKSDPSRK